MKKYITLLFLILTITFSFSQRNKSDNCILSFEVYLDDEDNYSNIRENPNGKIILKINNVGSCGYVLNVIGFENGWLKINQINGIDGYTISEFEGWIHSSIIGVRLTHSGVLLDKPNGKKVLDIEGESGETFKIEDVINCEWLKIKTKKGIGWVKSEKICGNPVTTCP